MKSTNMLFEKTLNLCRELDQFSFLLWRIKQDMTELYGEKLFDKQPEEWSDIQPLDKIGLELPANIREKILEVARNIDKITPLIKTARETHLNLSREILEIDEDIKQLSYLLPLEVDYCHPLASWWDLILRMQISQPISSFAILLWLPQNDEIAKYMSLDRRFHYRIHREIEKNEIIALSNSEFFIFGEGMKFTLSGKYKIGMCELIQRKLDIKSTELPCLVIFFDIIDCPHVIVDLKRLTSEEMGKVIIDIFSHISKTIEDKSIWDPRFWESKQASVLNRRIFDYLSGKQINEQTLQDEDNIRVIKAEQITFANLISQIIENFNFESSSIS